MNFRLIAICVSVILVFAGFGPVGQRAASAPADLEYIVVYDEKATPAAARAAVTDSGGSLVSERHEIGMAVVRSADPRFADSVARRPELIGAVPARPIGRLTGPASGGQQVWPTDSPPGADPFSHLQWAMHAIDATADGSYRVERGDRRTLVAVLDSGVDASHPDLINGVDRAHSANLLPAGAPGADEPAHTDPLGHGTVVAGLIAARLNGLGIAGVAPEASVVSLRVADASGFVFLGPVVDGLLRAVAGGASVAVMAFMVDPWLWACPNNAADTPAQQAEQRATIAVLGRAISYARQHGVLPVASIGDTGTDLDNAQVDDGSPSYPEGQAHHRDLDPTCLVLPAELDGVLGVSRLGRDLRLAASSNYGQRAVDVAAPGGTVPGPPDQRLLSTFPEEAAARFGLIDENGNPRSPFLLRDCRDGTCAYYLYTSLASPVAAGVAALIVSANGRPDGDHRGRLTLDPDVTERILRSSSTPTACPSGATTCVGPPGDNNHYGSGIVNALAAVGG